MRTKKKGVLAFLAQSTYLVIEHARKKDKVRLGKNVDERRLFLSFAIINVRVSYMCPAVCGTRACTWSFHHRNHV